MTHATLIKTLPNRTHADIWSASSLLSNTSSYFIHIYLFIILTDRNYTFAAKQNKLINDYSCFKRHRAHSWRDIILMRALNSKLANYKKYAIRVLMNSNCLSYPFYLFADGFDKFNGITYFDSIFSSFFFNYFMKYYLEPQTVYILRINFSSSTK